MAEPTPFALARLFTQLVGREVKFAQLTRPTPTKLKQMYGVYIVKPADTCRVVQTDLPLLGSFAGCLVGLPSDAVQDRLAEAALDESLRDAMHEVLNITATIVTVEGRAVFQSMYNDLLHCPSEAVDTMKGPLHRSHYQVSIDDYQGGAFSLFAQA